MGAGRKPLVMFIPLHDANSLKHIKLQYVTIGLIIANVLVYVLANIVPSQAVTDGLALSFGYTPAVFYDLRVLPTELAVIPDQLSLISYAFFHADLIHLGSNMLFLWVFGDNVEDAMGHVRFLTFYLLCAMAGALAHGLQMPSSESPLIGASGAVSGIIGAYLVLHPKVRIWVLAFGRLPLRLPAAIPLVLWIAFQLVALVAMPEDQVSWAAHIGGVLAGILLVFVFKRREVPLFDRTVVTPKAVKLEAPAPADAGEARTGVVRPWGRSG